MNGRLLRLCKLEGCLEFADPRVDLNVYPTVALDRTAQVLKVIGSPPGTRGMGTGLKATVSSAGRTDMVFVFLMPMVKPNFLQQEKKESSVVRADQLLDSGAILFAYSGQSSVYPTSGPSCFPRDLYRAGA